MHDEAASRSLLDVEALRQTHVLHGEAQRSLSKVIWRQPAGCPVSSSSNRGAEEPASYESAQLDRYLSEMEEKFDHIRIRMREPEHRLISSEQPVAFMSNRRAQRLDSARTRDHLGENAHRQDEGPFSRASMFEVDEIEEMLASRHKARSEAAASHAKRVNALQMHDEAASRSLLDVEALLQTHVLHGEAQRSLSKVIWRKAPGCPVSSSSNRGAEEPVSQRHSHTKARSWTDT